VDAVIGVWGADRVGVRLSPWGLHGDMHDSNPAALFTHAIEALSSRRIAYLHLIEPRPTAALMGQSTDAIPESALDLFREAFDGPLIAAGGFERASAIATVDGGKADAVAFGRHFIANPDLPKRLKLNAELNAYDRNTFYGGTEVGYTDYPALEAAEAV
jgi:N-ethylmaleimide reductase